MALNATKTVTNTKTGTSVTASYWKIYKESLDKQSMVATWTIGLFLNQTVADTAGSLPCGPSYTFKATVTKAQWAGDSIALGYTTIAAQVAAGVPKGPTMLGGTIKQAYTDLSGATSC